MNPRQRQNYNYGGNTNNRDNKKLLPIIYPVFVYFLICQIVNILLGLFPAAGQIDAVKRQGLGSLVAFVVLYLYFVRGEGTKSGEKKRIFAVPVSGKLLIGMVAAVLLLGCAGVGMNNLLALTSLKQLSEGYQTVEQAFYSSGLGWELLALGIVTPVAEELLYRYIVFYRLRSAAGRMSAVVGSALIFGLIHLNIVQTIYACVLGLVLGILMEDYQDVRVPICGHVTANVLSLLRGETGFLARLQPGDAWFLPVTIGLMALVVIIAGYYVRTFKND